MTNAEKIYEENRNRCKSIAKGIDLYVSGNAYKCPHCGFAHNFSDYGDEHETVDGGICYTCPECGEDIDESELEAISIYDYFDDVFDIEYRIGSDKEYRSVCVMVACGGPNIYIDTASKLVRLQRG